MRENSDENSEDTSIEAGSENEEDSSSGNDSDSIDDEENEEVKSSMDSLEEKLNKISEADSTDNNVDRYNRTIHLAHPDIDKLDINDVILPMKVFLKYTDEKLESFL